MQVIGDRNICNTGSIVIENKFVIKLIVMNSNEIFNKMSETVDSLNSIANSQVILAEAILKQRETDHQQSEALTCLARAAENNSLANLRLSESLIRDKDIMERLVQLLEEYKK